jgi:hypothetical protein
VVGHSATASSPPMTATEIQTRRFFSRRSILDYPQLGIENWELGIRAFTINFEFAI